jgi:NADH:ubiquinone oxidoreductase subunit 6 (subunit J)
MPVEILLIILTVVSALLAVELKNLLEAVAAFFIMSVLLAVIFLLMGAFYAAVFQFLVYAGAIVVLLLVAFHTVKK